MPTHTQWDDEGNVTQHPVAPSSMSNPHIKALDLEEDQASRGFPGTEPENRPSPLRSVTAVEKRKKRINKNAIRPYQPPLLKTWKESKLGRAVSIETNDHDDFATSECHQQGQSPLFGKLNVHVREQIFTLVLCQDEDAQLEDIWSYRSEPWKRVYGQRGPQEIHIALLATCRRAWLEYNSIPMLNATHTFWFVGGAQGVPHGNTRYHSQLQQRQVGCLGTTCLPFACFFKHLTPNNLVNLTHVRLVMSRPFLDAILSNHSTFERYFGLPAFRPAVLTLVPAEGGWTAGPGAGRRRGKPLIFFPAWLQCFLDSVHISRIPEVRLVLETSSAREEELLALLPSLLHLVSRTHVNTAHAYRPCRFVCAHHDVRKRKYIRSMFPPPPPHPSLPLAAAAAAAAHNPPVGRRTTDVVATLTFALEDTRRVPFAQPQLDGDQRAHRGDRNRVRTRGTTWHPNPAVDVYRAPRREREVEPEEEEERRVQRQVWMMKGSLLKLVPFVGEQWVGPE